MYSAQEETPAGAERPASPEETGPSTVEVATPAGRDGDHVARFEPADPGPAGTYDWKTELPGVFARHSADCPARAGQKCTCGPLGYRASARGETNLRTVSPVFDSFPEAVAWQRRQRRQRRRRKQHEQGGKRDQPGGAPGKRFGGTTLAVLIGEFLQAADDGTALDTDGRPYSHDGVRELRGGLSYVESELGPMTVQDVRRRHVQELVTELRSAGLASEGIFVVVDSLSSLYRYAARRDLVDFSPVVELDLPEREGDVSHADWQPSAGPDERWTPPSAEGWSPPSFPAPGYPTGGFPNYPTANPVQANANPTGTFANPTGTYANPTGTFAGLPGGQPTPDANYDATMQERWLWWTARIIVIVFVLIALVLAAESV